MLTPNEKIPEEEEHPSMRRENAPTVARTVQAFSLRDAATINAVCSDAKKKLQQGTPFEVIALVPYPGDSIEMMWISNPDIPKTEEVFTSFRYIPEWKAIGIKRCVA